MTSVIGGAVSMQVCAGSMAAWRNSVSIRSVRGMAIWSRRASPALSATKGRGFMKGSLPAISLTAFRPF